MISSEYEILTKRLIENKKSITMMESCSGGMIASLITDTPGASEIFKGAFITYSNESKIEAGVPEETIRKFGVYSTETASAMADVCRKHFSADIGIGVTGSLGRVDPANHDSIPGEVYFAVCTDETVIAEKIKICDFATRLDAKCRIAHQIYLKLIDLI